MEKRFVYADNSATTRVSQKALDAALPYFTELYGNPSSIYSLGMECAKAVLKAREQVANALGAKVNEIYFTAGGSESDNWAIRGCAQLGEKKGKKHIITTAFEHHAVLHTCQYLEKLGFEVTYLPVGDKGLVTAQQVEDAIREDTCLVTIMTANNEIGTIQPIAEIGEVCHKHGVWFHTDAVQAVGNIDINVKDMNIDMLSLSGHKLHAPKGVGALYVKTGINLPNLIYGGAQERNKRAGTENVPSIVALGVAITDAVKDIPAKNERVRKMRDRLIEGLLKIPESRLNGDTVEGIFEIKPWEKGETIIGKPDTEHRILLNASQSKIPEGVTVDYENNIVEVPATGVSDMKLAFVSDTRIDISATEGTGSGVNLSEMSVSEETEGIVSAFNVSVAAQGNG